jgi:hypothetical protein
VRGQPFADVLQEIPPSRIPSPDVDHSASMTTNVDLMINVTRADVSRPAIQVLVASTLSAKPSTTKQFANVLEDSKEIHCSNVRKKPPYNELLFPNLHHKLFELMTHVVQAHVEQTPNVGHPEVI